VGVVRDLHYVRRVNGLKETGPASATVKLPMQTIPFPKYQVNYKPMHRVVVRRLPSNKGLIGKLVQVANFWLV